MKSKWIMIGTQLRVQSTDSRHYHRVFDHFFEVESDSREGCLTEAALIHGRLNTTNGTYDEGTAVEWAGPYEVMLTIDQNDDPQNPDNYYLESGIDATRMVELQPSYAHAVAEKKRLADLKKIEDEKARQKEREAHERQILAQLLEKYGASS